MMDSINNGLIAQILLNSGKNVNDMGNYDGCLATKKTHYGMVSVWPDTNQLAAGLAICLPLECNEQELI